MNILIMLVGYSHCMLPGLICGYEARYAGLVIFPVFVEVAMARVNVLSSLATGNIRGNR
jgi:hypothetical protein